MAVKFSSSTFSCLANSLSSPSGPRISTEIALSQRMYDRRRWDALQPQKCKVQSCQLVFASLKLHSRVPTRTTFLSAISEDQSTNIELEPDALEQDSSPHDSEDISLSAISSIQYEGTDGKPGLISFYNRPYKREDDISIPEVQRNQSSVVWIVGPAVLVASFIFPSLYLRKIISMVFEDSLLTDFLILFFTEAIFYCGVAVFLLLVDCLRRPIGFNPATGDTRTPPPLLGQKISSVAALMLSLIIPMVTMGLVWPWTGPAASATLAPYLVGIVVQFAFEQYARYRKSPSWPVIPIIFHVYRLHQLNRAAQLVTALSFTVRGAEMTSHNLAINNSLGALLNVLQLLGVICIWSLSSFLMRFYPYTATNAP